MIDWTSRESHLLLNPRMPREERERLERAVPVLERHIFVATSGTTGAMKLVALSKDAVLASARAVNERLEARPNDIWCCVLPRFHVGGLGIYARAYLSGSRVLEMEWDPDAFVQRGATLASLVPAQVHDLVRANRQPPDAMRQILVGGGSFDPGLQRKARELGWPVLASYGSSECASTVAVENVVLSHLEARQDGDGRIALRGASLLTGYVFDNGNFVDPKVDGWFLTEDFGEINGRTLRVIGRAADFVKIGGESVDLKRLDRILDEVRGQADAAIVAVPDDRLGSVIHLAATTDVTGLVEAFNAQVLPFERVRGLHRVQQIPRSTLGKLLRLRLLELLE